jgi:predicted TIM-barrel fold metal-dependent hydrolase
LWDEFLMEFPDVPLLLKSMGQCPPFIEQALTLGERHPQVYLETSRAPAAAVKEAIRTVGPDRVVFGSGGMAQDFRREWEKIERLEAEISQDTFQRIVSGNARKLFFPSESVDRRWSNPVRSVRRPG